MPNYELKKLAMNAKNRLIGNKTKDGQTSRNKAAVLNSNIKIKTISLTDENFDNRAREVILRDALDPIREVMDMEYYKSLSPNMKDKYLLDIIEKYLACKKKFDREEERKTVL